MTKLSSVLFLFLSTVLLSCKSKESVNELRKMSDFDLVARNQFIEKLRSMPVLYEISIVDTRKDGNDFVVNSQHIFIDTVRQDEPNYYSVRKRAAELNLHVDSLFDCLKAFYQTGVNEFNRDSNYYRFRVTVGFTTNQGYIYADKLKLEPGDTLPATSVRNRDHHFQVVLTRQISNNWFEYYQIR